MRGPGGLSWLSLQPTRPCNSQVRMRSSVSLKGHPLISCVKRTSDSPWAWVIIIGTYLYLVVYLSSFFQHPWSHFLSIARKHLMILSPEGNTSRNLRTSPPIMPFLTLISILLLNLILKGANASDPGIVNLRFFGLWLGAAMMQTSLEYNQLHRIFKLLIDD